MSKIIPALLIVITLALTNHWAYAGSATWNLNPTSGDWNTAANWTPATVPNGPSDIATFGVSNITTLTISNFAYPDRIVFNPGASSYSIGPAMPNMGLSGAGVINNSGITQHLVAIANSLFFFGSASAGSNVTITTQGNPSSGVWGYLQFSENASAGSAVINCQGGTGKNQIGSLLDFLGNSTAGHSRITLNGGVVSGASGAIMGLYNDASLGNATLQSRVAWKEARRLTCLQSLIRLARRRG